MSDFECIKLYKGKIDLDYILQNQLTEHSLERNNRINYIRQHFQKKVNKTILKIFFVNKNHVNGPELHIITSDALIYIINNRTHKFVTVLFARPQQINRYYNSCNLKAPDFLIKKSYLNVKNNLNNL